MSLFNELHSKYYTLVNHILTSIHDEGITLNTLRKIVAQEGFLETPPILLPLLTAQDDEGYHLLCKKENTYYSVLQNKPMTFLTYTQKAWLKTLTLDSKIQLFLDEDELYELKKSLRDVEPLFLPETIHHVHQSSFNRNFVDDTYVSLFRTISNCLHHSQYMKITYRDEDDLLITEDIAGYKLEYRITQDSFHLIGIVYTDEQITRILRINLSSIQEVTALKTYFNPKEIEAAMQAYKCKEPLYFELSNARKGFDRVFMLKPIHALFNSFIILLMKKTLLIFLFPLVLLLRLLDLQVLEIDLSNALRSNAYFLKNLENLSFRNYFFMIFSRYPNILYI